LTLAFAWGVFYSRYVRVDPLITKAFENRDLQALKSLAGSSEFNWYQRSSAIEKYSSLNCEKEDPFLRSVLISSDTSMRRAALEGCFAHSSRKVDWVIPIGLKDPYSFNRYQTLHFLSEGKNPRRFRIFILPLREDGSTMVSNEADRLLRKLESMASPEEK